MPDIGHRLEKTMHARITLDLQVFGDEHKNAEALAHAIRDLVHEHMIVDVKCWEGEELELVSHEITELGYTRVEREWVVKDDNFFADEAS